MSQSLKYMGMGGLVRAGERSQPTAGPAGEDDSAAAPKGAGKPGTSSKVSWAGAFGLSTGGGGEPSAQRARKKSVAEEAEEEDDRHIRFTIGGVGQRMTKADFIREMQKFDKSTRREIVEHSDASGVIKTLANQDIQPTDSLDQSSSRGKAVAGRPANTSERTKPSETDSSSSNGGRRRSLSTSPSPTGSPAPRKDDDETAVERRRRLAVLKSVGDDQDEMAETPAERRRREAALGMSSTGADEDEDSEDDDTPRVPRAKRGIRFADAPDRSKR